MNKPNIREALVEDLPGLLALEQGIIDAERPFHRFIKESDASYYDIPYLISDSDFYLIVVESDKEIVGSGYAQIRESKSCFTHEYHCYLGFIYLSPEHRGIAIGKGIIDALKEWGINRGMHHFHLDVYSENESAIRAYEKAGFNKVSVMMEFVV